MWRPRRYRSRGSVIGPEDTYGGSSGANVISVPPSIGPGFVARIGKGWYCVGNVLCCHGGECETCRARNILLGLFRGALRGGVRRKLPPTGSAAARTHEIGKDCGGETRGAGARRGISGPRTRTVTLTRGHPTAKGRGRVSRNKLHVICHL